MTATADLGFIRIGLISTHLSVSGDDRREEVIDLMEIVSNLTGPVVVGGDLNLEPWDDFMAPLDPDFFGVSFGDNLPSDPTPNAPLRSAFHLGSPRNVWRNPTYPAEGLDDDELHVDYILITEGIDVVASGIEEGRDASDHRPVWATIRIE